MIVTMQKQKTKCLVCNEEGFFIKKLDKYDIWKCESCGLEYVYPMPTEQELNNFYSNYTDIQAGDVVLKKMLCETSKLYPNMDYP